MSSHRQILYHIVFRTKDSKPVLIEANSTELYKYIFGIIRNKNCNLYWINGTEDHLHILTDLHPGISLADYVREIKVSASVWIKSKNIFPGFTGWAEGYCAFTYAYRDKNVIINYIKNQKEHHRKVTFQQEYISLLEEFGISYDIRYL